MTKKTTSINATISIADAISALEALGYTVTAPTGKSKPKTANGATPSSEPVEEPKKKSKVRTVGCLEQDGKAVRFVVGQFVPKKAWYGITCAIKEAGAKFDPDTKVWVFESAKSAKEFMDKQAEREKARAEKSDK